MSLATALDELRSANVALEAAVAELVMTVVEDRPVASEIAVVDNLGEIVSELQASVAETGAQLTQVSDVRHLPVRLPQIEISVATSSVRYWSELRAHSPVAELRAAARNRGVEWRTWQQSVEQSQLRCEAHIERSSASVRAAWREVGELLSLYIPTAEMPSPASPTEHQTSAPAGSASMTTRRPS